MNVLHTLMRHGEAARVTSLMYLTPVFAVVLELLMFGVVPTPLSLAGMAITCLGVAMVAWQKAGRRRTDMRLWQLVVLTILTHTAFNGSRMLVSLYAIHLHASAFTVGTLMSSFALLPMLLAVSAGRLIDRGGARWPLFAASLMVALGALLPYFWPRLLTLYIASTLIGTGFMVFHVAVNQVVGAIGRAEERAANFSWLALGFSVSSSLGPLVTGFAIDAMVTCPPSCCSACFRLRR